MSRAELFDAAQEDDVEQDGADDGLGEQGVDQVWEPRTGQIVHIGRRALGSGQDGSGAESRFALVGEEREVWAVEEEVEGGQKVVEKVVLVGHGEGGRVSSHKRPSRATSRTGHHRQDIWKQHRRVEKRSGAGEGGETQEEDSMADEGKIGIQRVDQLLRVENGRRGSECGENGRHARNKDGGRRRVDNIDVVGGEEVSQLVVWRVGSRQNRDRVDVCREWERGQAGFEVRHQRAVSPKGRGWGGWRGCCG